MHWYGYPSPTHRRKTNQYILQPCVVKTVGVTGKISKWQPEKRAPKVLSLFLPAPKCKRFKRHRSMDGHQWKVSLPIVDFSHELLQKPRIKTNEIVTN